MPLHIERPRTGLLMLLGGLLVTAVMIGFAFNSLRNAQPVAQTLLRGLALSLGQTIEALATRDPSLKALSGFRYRDIAYFALIDRTGRIRFHQNPELTGETVDDDRYLAVFSVPGLIEKRIRLGTGEEAYEAHLPLHLPWEPLALRLVLHTWQADQIIRRARTGATLLLTLTASAWVLGLLLLRLQKREARQREQMARQEQMARLGELGAVLAHEVRTPLSGIKGYAQLLAERLEDHRSRRFASLIAQEALRLEGLVNDLLDYARQDDPSNDSILLDEAFVEEAWQAIDRGDSPQLTPVLTIQPELRVACRPARLRQVLINLFSNARQAMPAGGEVQLSVAEGRKGILLTLRDSGPGFNEEALKRAFDPFFTTRPRGSGLGLAVCRKIVEGCKGSISATNIAGGGAEISVLLPRAPERKSS